MLADASKVQYHTEFVLMEGVNPDHNTADDRELRIAILQYSFI